MVQSSSPVDGGKPPDGRVFNSTGPHGHRGRMRGRLLANEQALADYEILEMLLFLGIERRDTKPLAKGLINQFGSLSGTIGAERDALRGAGLTAAAIEALDLVVAAATDLARPELIRRVVIKDLSTLERHLRLDERTARPPGLSALLLNNRNQLLGEPDWPAETPPGELARELVRHALDRHATAAILIRNAGPVSPQVGAADRALHVAVQAAGQPLSVVVHDLVVVGLGNWVSLRQRRH